MLNFVFSHINAAKSFRGLSHHKVRHEIGEDPLRNSSVQGKKVLELLGFLCLISDTPNTEVCPGELKIRKSMPQSMALAQPNIHMSSREPLDYEPGSFQLYAGELMGPRFKRVLHIVIDGRFNYA